MGWQFGNQTQESSQQEQIFVSFPPLKKPYEYTDIRMRVISGAEGDPSQPVDTWQHWIDNRPYNCPGYRVCPVCARRNILKNELSDEEFKKHRLYRLSRRYYFNVLVYEGENPETKVFGFGPSVAKKLYSLASRLGDLRGYDVTVRQTKNGPLSQNVEYDAWNEKDRDLTEEDKEKMQEVFDLSAFAEPSPVETLLAVVEGHQPNGSNNDVSNKLEEIAKLAKEKKGITLEHLGFDENTPTPLLDGMLESLRSAPNIPF